MIIHKLQKYKCLGKVLPNSALIRNNYPLSAKGADF